MAKVEKDMHVTQSALALRQARSHLLEYGNCPPGAIDERIARSWRRSLAAGLLPQGRLADAEHAGGNLRHLLAGNNDLLAHSRPVMEYLYAQVKHSHSMVILADRQATLLHTMGDVDFLSRAERVALSSGACWQEQRRGTNAIGTALAEADCVEVHGAEHFLERNGFLTCAAAPVMSADGTLLGVIDISGDQRSRHPHTLGLVGMAARMIENRMIVASCSGRIRLHLHAHPEGIGSVAEGILVLSDDGWIAGANRTALSMLGLTAADLGGTPLERAIDARLCDLLARSRSARPTQVHLRDGTCVFVQVHAAQSAAIPSFLPAALPDDALSALDIGDPLWRSATQKVRCVAGKPIPVLIQGESGVGKELFARAIHESGPRRNGPFVAVNCAALPENLIEAELFGYSPGAYTGARREGSPGRLREAEGGTLFLDEIGDMPQALQTRLLRVLQQRQVTPLGGGKSFALDFALISATHHKLRIEAEKGVFRSDLYYRINGLTVTLPALRERSDFQALTERLLAEINPDRDVYVSPDLLWQLSRHRWPGNLRQYSSVLRTASAMLDAHERCIEPMHLPEDMLEDLASSPERSAPVAPRNLRELSIAAIEQTLQDCCGNISEASRRLGISRQTLYRKIGPKNSMQGAL